MLKIVHVTDTHIPGMREEKIHGIAVFNNLEKIVGMIGQIRDVDCIIITGDIANYGDYEGYMNVNLLFSELEVPVYWLQGNHDFAEVMLQVSSRVKIRADKSFIIKDTKFILLQTTIPDEKYPPFNKGLGRIFPYELSFLKRELEENNFAHCVVAMHHHPIASDFWADERILVNREELTDLIRQYPKVKVVLYGHQHIARITEFDGIKYISSPPASYSYDPGGPMYAHFDNQQGFGIVRIDPGGQVIFEARYI